MAMDPVPQRLSDAERDEAVDALRQHFADGRLTAEEAEQRTSAALSARTSSDVDALFTDLPQPRPHYLAGPATWNNYPAATAHPVTSRPSPGSSAIATRSNSLSPATADDRAGLLAGLSAAVWPVAILMVVFGGHGYWPIIAAIVISSVLGGLRRRRRQPPPYTRGG